jgi:hypothetical protein
VGVPGRPQDELIQDLKQLPSSVAEVGAAAGRAGCRGACSSRLRRLHRLRPACVSTALHCAPARSIQCIAVVVVSRPPPASPALPPPPPPTLVSAHRTSHLAPRTSHLAPRTSHPLPAQVMAACQSLVQVDDELIGDPLETASIEAVGWTYSGDVALSPDRKVKATILHRCGLPRRGAAQLAQSGKRAAGGEGRCGPAGRLAADVGAATAAQGEGGAGGIMHLPLVLAGFCTLSDDGCVSDKPPPHPLLLTPPDTVPTHLNPDSENPSSPHTVAHTHLPPPRRRAGTTSARRSSAWRPSCAWRTARTARPTTPWCSRARLRCAAPREGG